MIIIRSQINEVVLSVTDQSTLSAPIYYLFELKRQASNVKYYCIAQITTNYGSRQLFNITENNTPAPLAATLKLQSGTYEYKVYQQASGTNLDPALTTVAASGFAWVASGILTVSQTSTAPAQYVGADSTNPVYEG